LEIDFFTIKILRRKYKEHEDEKYVIAFLKITRNTVLKLMHTRHNNENITMKPSVSFFAIKTLGY
jgi:hypothetical protein